MANILDYVRCRGDLDFESSCFNEIDNLILSQLFPPHTLSFFLHKAAEVDFRLKISHYFHFQIAQILYPFYLKI